MDIKIMQGCKMGAGIFASFIELEMHVLKHCLEPRVIPKQVNVTCPSRNASEKHRFNCPEECTRLTFGFYSGPHVSFRIKGARM